MATISNIKPLPTEAKRLVNQVQRSAERTKAKTDTSSPIPVDEQNELFEQIKNLIAEQYFLVNDKFTTTNRTKNVLEGIVKYVCDNMKTNDEALWNQITTQIETDFTNDLTTTLQPQVSSIIQKVLDYLQSKQLSDIKDSLDSTGSSSSVSSISFDRGRLTALQKQYVKTIATDPKFIRYVNGVGQYVFNGLVSLLKHYRVKFEGRKELVKAITNVILNFSRKYEDGIRRTYDEFDKSHTSEYNRLLGALRRSMYKDMGSIETKRDKHLTIKNMSLKQAFVQTLKNNSTWYLKNSNIFGRVLVLKIKKVGKKIKTISLHTMAFWRRYVMHPIRTFKRWFKLYKVINLGINAAKLFLTLRIVAAKIMVETFWIATKFLLKGSKFLLRSGKRLVGFSMRAISGIFRKVKGVVSGTARKITGFGKSFWNFFVNNTFGKRLVKFLKSDAGAFFLGILAAFVKVRMIDPIVKMLRMGLDVSLPKLPELFEDINSRIHEMFLEDKYHIREITEAVLRLSNFVTEKLIDVQNSGNDILQYLKNIDFVKKLETLKTFASAFLRMCDMIISHRFTFGALKATPMKLMLKNPWTAIFGLGATLLADTMLNRKISNAISSDGEGVKIRFGKPQKTEGILDRGTVSSWLLSKIKDRTIKDEDAQKWWQNYMQMRMEVDKFEETTNTFKKDIQDGMKAEEKVLKANYSDSDMNELFDILSEVNLYGKRIFIGDYTRFHEAQTRNEQFYLLGYMIQERESIVNNLKDRLISKTGKESFAGTLDQYWKDQYKNEYKVEFDSDDYKKSKPKVYQKGSLLTEGVHFDIPGPIQEGSLPKKTFGNLSFKSQVSKVNKVMNAFKFLIPKITRGSDTVGQTVDLENMRKNLEKSIYSGNLNSLEAIYSDSNEQTLQNLLSYIRDESNRAENGQKMYKHLQMDEKHDFEVYNLDNYAIVDKNNLIEQMTNAVKEFATQNGKGDEWMKEQHQKDIEERDEAFRKAHPWLHSIGQAANYIP